MSYNTTRRVLTFSATLLVFAALAMGGCATEPEGPGDNRFYTSYSNLARERDLAAAEQRVGNLRAADPLRPIVTYPDDWADVTRKRLDGGD